MNFKPFIYGYIYYLQMSLGRMLPLIWWLWKASLIAAGAFGLRFLHKLDKSEPKKRKKMPIKYLNIQSMKWVKVRLN